MSDVPYKFKTTLKDYKLNVEAIPQYEAISGLYATLAKGIDEELIRNMPESVLIKLLSQLLEAYRQRPVSIGKESDIASLELLYALREEYGV